MVKFDEAVLILKSLPAQQQEAAINVILDIASQPNDVQLTDEQAAEMERRLNDPSVELISLDEFRARVAKIVVASRSNDERNSGHRKHLQLDC